MHHSFWIETVALITDNPNSIRGCVSIGQFDPDDWNFPPTPKWMRWKTFKRYEERFERHEAQLNAGLEKMVARLKLFESK